jgi:hypothetical protein
MIRFIQLALKWLRRQKDSEPEFEKQESDISEFPPQVAQPETEFGPKRILLSEDTHRKVEEFEIHLANILRNRAVPLSPLSLDSKIGYWIEETLLDFHDEDLVLNLILEHELEKLIPGITKDYGMRRCCNMSSWQLNRYLEHEPTIATDWPFPRLNSPLVDAYIKNNRDKFDLLLEYGANLQDLIMHNYPSSSTRDSGETYFVSITPWLPDQSIGMTLATAINLYGPDEFRTFVVATRHDHFTNKNPFKI